MTNQDIEQLNTRFDQQDVKFDALAFRFDDLVTIFDQQGVRFDEMMAFVSKQFTKVATKEDLVELKNDIYLNMASKSELAEVKEIVVRLDKRTDEDIKATIKDVEKIKGVLSQ